MPEPYRSALAIGLMSGTSMDGIDIALIDADGERLRHAGPVMSLPYSGPERALLREAIASARGLSRRDDRSGVLKIAEAMVTGKHGGAVNAFVDANKIDRAEIAAIGFHGQTVLHRPEKRLTVQLGDGQRLADMTGMPVVYDFRAADMAAGGQGAPLVPVFHRALASGSPLAHPLAVVNIGGVANITWIGRDGRLVAFDAGPGNALIDDWALRHTGEPIDRDGRLAAQGQADQAALAKMLRHPFFAASPPKSLDRHDFDLAAISHLNAADGAATLTAFTAASIMLAGKFLPEKTGCWVLAGGGARNPVLTAALRKLAQSPVMLAQEAGWLADFIEAQAFAFLAIRSLKGLPLTFPATTGAPQPLSGGVLARPRLSQKPVARSA